MSVRPTAPGQLPTPSPSRSTPAVLASAAPVDWTGSAARTGFHAELDGVNLWDLVQMECLGRSRSIIQVSGDGGVGYLYFSGGRVTHAVTPRLVGEAAALEILSWTAGAFAPCEREWPDAPTIDTSHEALLLLAAQRRDEAASRKLLAFPAPDVAPGDEHGKENWKTGDGDMAEARRPTMTPPGTGTGTAMAVARNDPMPDFSVMIRVAPSGVIVKNKGGTEELAGVVAYTARLVELVGTLLGLDRFVAMECTFKEPPGQASPTHPRCLLFTEANGDAVAVRPRPESNIQPLRESLGL